MQYLVEYTNVIEADSPEEAVREAITILRDQLDRHVDDEVYPAIFDVTPDSGPISDRADDIEPIPIEVVTSEGPFRRLE